MFFWKTEDKYFCAEGWTGQISVNLLDKLAFRRNDFFRPLELRWGRKRWLPRRAELSALDCTPGVRHDNFCDRLVLGMTCGSKGKDPSVSDGVQIEGDQAS